MSQTMSQIPQSPTAALRPLAASRTIINAPGAGYGRHFRHGRRRGWVLPLLLDLLLEWQERARQRHDLRSLDDRMLSDIGLSRADVEGECSKPFWKV